MKSAFLLLICFLIVKQEKLLDQDIIYPKAAQEKMFTDETLEVISGEEMANAKGILQKYWKKNRGGQDWVKYNRQYMVYNSKQMGRVVWIYGSCLEKNKAFYEKQWVLGMAVEKCYYSCFVDTQKKKVVKFEFMTYDKK